MIYDIFKILLWVTVILLVLSGIDDLIIDLLYWLRRGRYKRSLPTLDDLLGRPERAIALMIGAWQEYKVIGRTISLALKNIKYSNYKIFVAVYPNDLRTVKVVREFARRDNRVILCLNPQDGPTTKADNLNNLYACVLEYEKIHGNFDIMLVHDSEDFIHPLSLKVFNYMIMYKGYYAVQIPVIPIKSSIGKFFHRTYCDAFSELHTKDMIVRQTSGTFIPFAGTGMAFNRKAFFYLESHSKETPAVKSTDDEITYSDNEGVETYQSDKNAYDEINQIRRNTIETERTYSSSSRTDEDVLSFEPDYRIKTDELRKIEEEVSRHTGKSRLKQYSFLLLFILAAGIIFIIYNSNISSKSVENTENTENLTSVADNNEYVEQKNISEKNYIKEEVKNHIPKGISEFSKGYTDDLTGLIYVRTKDGKYSIQESSWSSRNSALKQVMLLTEGKKINNDDIIISQVENNSRILFRVLVGKFDNLENTRSFAISNKLSNK